jgi:hypothetical protein
MRAPSPLVDQARLRLDDFLPAYFEAAVSSAVDQLGRVADLPRWTVTFLPRHRGVDAPLAGGP